MRLSRRSILATAAAALAGCRSYPIYFHEQKRYDSEEEFFDAVNATIKSALETITPLPAPLTTRSLVFALPGASVFQATARQRFAESQNRSPNRIEVDHLKNLPLHAYLNLKIFGQAVQKRNIYSSVRLVDTESATATVAPSSEMDAIYFVDPAPNSGQWYYATAKHGIQIFAYDRSLPGAPGKLKGFIDGVQAMAIRA